MNVLLPTTKLIECSKKIYKYIHLNIYRINIPFYRILLMRTPRQPPSSSSQPSS